MATERDVEFLMSEINEVSIQYDEWISILHDPDDETDPEVIETNLSALAGEAVSLMVELSFAGDADTAAEVIEHAHGVRKDFLRTLKIIRGELTDDNPAKPAIQPARVRPSKNVLPFRQIT